MLGYEHGFAHQAKDFVEAIAAGVQPTPSFADGLQVQRVLGAVEQSSARRRLDRDRRLNRNVTNAPHVTNASRRIQ